jgi:hypothetical protein
MSYLVRKYPLPNYKGKTYEVLDEEIGGAISHGSAGRTEAARRSDVTAVGVWPAELRAVEGHYTRR